MSNDGLLSTNIQGSNLDAATMGMRTYYDPIKLMTAAPDDKTRYKATFTKAWWNNPIFGRPRDINYTYLEEYENNVWIRIIVSHICDSVVQTGHQIVAVNEDKKDDVPESHITELQEFFSSKSWTESWGVTLRRLIPDLLLYDCGVIVKLFPKIDYNDLGELKNEKSKPLGLISRDGRSFLVDSDLFGNTKRYFQYSWISPQARPISFDKDEIVYMQMRPQSRSPYGIASLEIVKDLLDYLTASITTQRKYYENNFPVGGTIDHPDMVDIEELRQRAQLYKETLQGENNSGKWLMTMGGTVVTPLQQSARDSQWLESSQFFGKLIFALFKIAPSELGFTENLNRATAESQSENYKQKGVRNILSLLEEYINREIVYKHFYTDVKFKFDDALDLTDRKTQSDIDHTQLTDGTITINEIRNRDGKALYDDEEFNNPFAEMAMQNKMMEEGGEEGEDEGEFNEEPEVEFKDEDVTKAVTTESAFIPTKWDRQEQKKQEKKDKEVEEDSVKELQTWSDEKKKIVEENLREFYDKT